VSYILLPFALILRCTGARILMTLMGERVREGHDLILASLCTGGGQGKVTVLERV
jgi:acetyl-CoA acetyltransferase